MGRELKRVPLDFDYPIDKVWEGYLNPYRKACPHCSSNGHSAAYKRLDRLVSLIMLSGSDAQRGKDHPYFEWMARYISGFDSTPSPDMSELTSGLGGRELDGHHDGSDTYVATKKIIEAAGLDPALWGVCVECKGEGNDPALKEACDAWRETPPPTGDGFQLWTTTTQGSPISPVFSTLDELCIWCESNATPFGTRKASRYDWQRMLNTGFVYSQEGGMIFS